MSRVRPKHGRPVVGPVERLVGLVAAPLARLHTVRRGVAIAVAGSCAAVLAGIAGYAAIGVDSDRPQNRFVAPTSSGPAGSPDADSSGASGGPTATAPTGPTSTVTPSQGVGTVSGSPAPGSGSTPPQVAPSPGGSLVVRQGTRCSPIGAVAVTARGQRVECIQKPGDGAEGRWRRV